MRKVAKLLLLFSFVSQDLKVLLENVLRGTPEKDGVFLLGPNTNIRSKLVDHLNEYEPVFDIYGDGRHSIPCTLINIVSNNIYIYSHINEDTATKLCGGVQGSFLAAISNSIEIPFYIKWLGYSAVHFELFGSYTDLTENNLMLHVKSLIVGSTVILTGVSLKPFPTLNEELILKNFIAHTDNPYIKFIHYVVTSPVNNTIAIATDLGVQIFSTNIDEISDTTDFGILNWQKKQIQLFINFFQKEVCYLNGYPENEFQKFIASLQDINNSFAQASGYIDTLQKLHLSRYKELLLFYYIHTQDEIAKVYTTIKNGVSVHSKLLNGATPLYISAHLGKFLMTKLLISLHSDVEAVRDNNSTALMAASFNNFSKIAELLISYGANVDAYDSQGNSPLMLASAKGHYEMVRILISANANIEHKNKSGYNILMITSALGNHEIAQQLLYVGVDVNTEGGGWTPITLAIYGEHLEMLRLLLAYGATVPTDEKFYIHSELMNNEITQYQLNKTAYILSHHHEVQEVIRILNNMESYEQLEPNDQYIDQIKSCLSGLNQDQSYDNLLFLCEHSMQLGLV